jgi:hypothetical protein
MGKMKELYTEGVTDLQSYNVGVATENERIINLLIDLNAIRRDALGSLVAFNTYGDKVIYLPGLEHVHN